MTAPTHTEDAEATAEDDAAAAAPSFVDALMPGRRDAMFMIGGGVFGAVFGGGVASFAARPPGAPQRDDSVAMTYKEAKERLDAGNARYVAGQSTSPESGPARRAALAGEEHPFAAVLCCAESRVPPEIVFDQGLGDLFVVRSLGEAIDRAVLGSLQYGVAKLQTVLLVVLGHSDCAALQTAQDALAPGGKPLKNEIDTVVAEVSPAVKKAKAIGAEDTDLIGVAVHLNVERIVDRLKLDPVIGVADNKLTLKVVGAVYDVTTGEVEWS